MHAFFQTVVAEALSHTKRVVSELKYLELIDFDEHLTVAWPARIANLRVVLSWC